jgi:hypothetical protein
MTQSTIGGFFTGGGKGITWPDEPGKSVTGTITAVHEPEAVLDPKTGQPTDRQQVRMELQTDERDPEADFDDGQRTLYVKSYMRGAIGDALRRAGAREPKIGGKLTVTFVRTEPPERPGLSASKHFEAVYEPPSTTGSFFGNGDNSAAPSQPPAAQALPPKPAAIAQEAWNAMPDNVKRSVAATMGAMATDEPPF